MTRFVAIYLLNYVLHVVDPLPTKHLFRPRITSARKSLSLHLFIKIVLRNYIATLILQKSRHAYERVLKVTMGTSDHDRDHEASYTKILPTPHIKRVAHWKHPRHQHTFVQKRDGALLDVESVKSLPHPK
jgi:hypothetical protein